MNSYVFAGLPQQEATKIVHQKDNKLMLNVVNAICIEMNLTKDDITSKSRKRELAEARQIAILIITENYPSIIQKQIETFFNMDRSTVSYNKDTCADYIRTNKYFKAKYNSVVKALQANN